MRDIYSYKNSFEKYTHIKTKLIVKSSVVNPELSIFIPTYKRNNTLEETLISALNQDTGTPYEIIIVSNDPEGANDGTKGIINKFSSNKISFFVNSENIGLCGNWNRGIELAKSNYVSMIHDDDILSPFFVDSVLCAIKNNNCPGIIGVDYCLFNSKSKPEFRYPTTMCYRTVSKIGFFFGRYINIAGITVKKSLIKDIGGYAEDYYPNEDTILIYQALLKEKVINICFPLAGYRQEYNASLAGSTMEEIIFLTELTRKNIAEHEIFAKIWMFLFDKEFLYDYVKDANKYWNLNIDYQTIFKKCDLKTTTINIFKLRLMRFISKIIRKGLIE